MALNSLGNVNKPLKRILKMNKLQIFQHSALSTGFAINMELDEQFDDFELNNYEFFKFLLLGYEICELEYDYVMPLEWIMTIMYSYYINSPEFTESDNNADPYELLVSYLTENKHKIIDDIQDMTIPMPKIPEGFKEELKGYITDLLPVYSVAYALIAFVDGVRGLSIPYDYNFELAYLIHAHLKERHQDLMTKETFKNLTFDNYIIETIPMNDIALLDFCKRFSD